jgi:methyl farnesoate epoxidase/farnesoate epoxidase
VTFFGVGKRRCVGEILARAETYLFFASLVLSFRFRPEKAHARLDFAPINGLIQYPKPFSVIVESRM